MRLETIEGGGWLRLGFEGSGGDGAAAIRQEAKLFG